MKTKKEKEKDRIKWTLIIAIIIAALWYFCIIRIAEYPSPYCAPASGNGISNNVSNAGSGAGVGCVTSCPVCSSCPACSDPCLTGSRFDGDVQMCVPNALPDPDSMECVYWDKFYPGYCDCPDGYTWNPEYYLCIASVY